MSSSCNQSATPSITDSTPSSSTQRKKDPAWQHCKYLQDGSKILVCLFCQKVIRGGGITRIKKHLACQKGDVEGCPKVSPEVSFEMRRYMDRFPTKKRKNQEQVEDSHRHGPSPRVGGSGNKDVVKIQPTKAGGSGSKKVTTDSFFMKKTQPIFRSVSQTKEEVDIAVSKWMIDASVPFNAANSLYYQVAIDAMTNYGAGYKGPSFHHLRGFLLTKNVEEINAFVESYRPVWQETGCSIMADSSTDQNGTTLINFLVYCPKGTVFLKSIDASAQTDEVLLYEMFKEVVLFVGRQNVVQVITDNNAPNYVAAGRLLEAEFPTLYWTPCAAHCLNLMFDDMEKLEEVNYAILHASKITKYIYNHCYALHLMRQYTNGKEILRPAPTRFATNFFTLKGILGQKNALQDMVMSREWLMCAYSRDAEGRGFVNDVLDPSFWKSCALVVTLTEPLVRVLRIVESDDRPAMGFLYDAFVQAREEMVRRFQRRKKVVAPYLEMVDARWDPLLMKNLNLAGYWLNPMNLTVNNELHKKATTGLLDVFERYSDGNLTLNTYLTSEMKIFRNLEGDFGRRSATLDRAIMQPDEWWRIYGNSAPNLQKLAVRVLSQTCSSSGCERNWSIFEHIHSKKRNRLEHQRLNDLVYVHYNLRLQQRFAFKGRDYDPISFEDFRNYAIWVLEDEPSNLTTDEVESFRQELAACTIHGNQNDDEPLNFDDLSDGDEVEVEVGEGSSGREHDTNSDDDQVARHPYKVKAEDLT